MRIAILSTLAGAALLLIVSMLVIPQLPVRPLYAPRNQCRMHRVQIGAAKATWAAEFHVTNDNVSPLV